LHTSNHQNKNTEKITHSKTNVKDITLMPSVHCPWSTQILFCDSTYGTNGVQEQ